MRALVIGPTASGAAGLHSTHVPDPVPAPGQVLIAVRTTTVNFADYKQLRDWTSERDGRLVPGHEVVGAVAGLGDGVEDLAIGQRVGAVTVGGSFCELALAERGQVIPLPDDVPDERAVGLVALGTAYNALTLMGRLVRGERVMVNAAAGGVGSTVTQMARALGAVAVVGLVGSEQKVAVVERNGGRGIATDYGPDVVPTVLDQLGGPADVIVDSVGGPAMAANLACLAPFGRLVICGHTAGRWGDVPSVQLQERHQTVAGYRGRLLLRSRPEVVIEGIVAGLELVRTKDVEILVERVLPLDQAAEAFRHLRQRSSVGKLVLQI